MTFYCEILEWCTYIVGLKCSEVWKGTKGHVKILAAVLRGLFLVAHENWSKLLYSGISIFSLMYALEGLTSTRLLTVTSNITSFTSVFPSYPWCWIHNCKIWHRINNTNLLLLWIEKWQRSVKRFLDNKSAVRQIAYKTYIFLLTVRFFPTISAALEA